MSGEARESAPFVLEATDPKERVKELTDKLEDGVRDVFESGRYGDYLASMSKFHNYSANNTLLIFMQRPDASYVAGFNKWRNDFGRTVKKGERAIRIVAPAPKTIRSKSQLIDEGGKPVLNENGNPVTVENIDKIPTFKVVSVFDVSQTEGDDLPSVVGELDGSVEGYEDLMSVLKDVSPVPIAFEAMGPDTKGYFHRVEKRIALAEGQSQIQSVKTCIHEIAHATLHDPDMQEAVVDTGDLPNRRTREVQAESVAFTVCSYLGLDTSDYSFGYIAEWSASKETSELKDSIECIRAASSGLIEGIGTRMAQMREVREQARDMPLAARALQTRIASTAILHPSTQQRHVPQREAAAQAR